MTAQDGRGASGAGAYGQGGAGDWGPRGSGASGPASGPGPGHASGPGPGPGPAFGSAPGTAVGPHSWTRASAAERQTWADTPAPHPPTHPHPPTYDPATDPALATDPLPTTAPTSLADGFPSQRSAATAGPGTAATSQAKGRAGAEPPRPPGRSPVAGTAISTCCARSPWSASSPSTSSGGRG